MSQDGVTIFLTHVETPIGTMVACAVEQGLCLLEFAERPTLKKQFTAIKKLFNGQIIEGESIYFELLRQQLSEYFERTRKVFSIPLVTPGTDFQQLVWKELQNVPFGITRTYKQQSIALNNLEAIRAVASANGMNRIAIIIPCHRIIGNDGSLTGYAGGLWRKQWLLDFERGTQRLDF
ncbi:MAG: methylated-DNA--[protein]-cysteine S-methyltransferase [Bacteroidetes bacterium]|nr:methylated-DNA--[protein]-cysteine S-methyltransferase [Bacteroidota bacterium]